MEFIYDTVKKLLILVTIYYSIMIPRYVLFGDRDKRVTKKKIMIVFGSGGHTTEMILMLEKLNFQSYKEYVFVIGHSDTWSLTKITDFYKKQRNIDIRDIQNLKI